MSTPPSFSVHFFCPFSCKFPLSPSLNGLCVFKEVKAIMAARVLKAASMDCDGIEPDNMMVRGFRSYSRSVCITHESSVHTAVTHHKHSPVDA